MVRSMDDDDAMRDCERCAMVIFFGFFTHSVPGWLRRRRACKERERERDSFTHVDELDCVEVERLTERLENIARRRRRRHSVRDAERVRKILCSH